MSNIFDLFRQIEKKEPTGQPEFLIVGLGNPGSEYEYTRHNAGFLAIDEAAKRYGCSKWRIKFISDVSTCLIGGKTCLLMKPSTYMNKSGEAVVEAMNFYKIKIQNVIVICDDISLDCARMRIRAKGSDGGHNGLKNIIYLTGSNEFARIKIGVGKKPHPDYDLAAWVLSDFTKDEFPAMQESFAMCAEAIEYIVRGDMSGAMNKFNTKKA